MADPSKSTEKIQDDPSDNNTETNSQSQGDAETYSLKTTNMETERVIRNQAGDVVIEPFSAKGTYRVPLMGSKCTKYAETGLNVELLRRGEREIMNYQCNLNGHLNEETYELIRTNDLSPDTIAALNPKLTRLAAEPKFIFLKRRYYLDYNGLIHDHLRNDRVVCEPVFVFDMIMGCHFMNDHGTYNGVFQSLADFYSNITRDLVNKAIQYCSVCNPEEKIQRLEKFKHRNIYKTLMPLERIHIELVEPFKDQKIEGKYSHIMYARDYHSRFVWAYPVKGLKFNKIVSVMSGFLLSLMRQPIFIETTSIPETDMFDICEKIATKYQMKIGLGTKRMKGFHSAGVRQFKRRLNFHEEECLKDWNMCLKYGVMEHNRSFSDRAGATPSNILCSEIHDIGQKFKDKVDQILEDSESQSVVKAGEGLIYIEVSDEKLLDMEESEDEGQQEDEPTEMEQDPETLTGMIPINPPEETNEHENDNTSGDTTMVPTPVPNHKRTSTQNSVISQRKRSKKNDIKSEGISMEI
ncbi:similar to Saccharomyces cerevisiae YDR110W FOB1 Nucleolar protein that binds the rDNA replication fork barrier (RFB) site [Maudiozyma saulgeensis]|uniref:Similar to Saccharomyces cerevisiae YDR110W FOB1 Nucleolar protein that binds the rDNA replication fork barrier (RFB) site n=1 Tax=Maudiozyma saulgeensis TaxID=1789683 RepID=A0A1X7R607_9SACH|nr:similar to Saccharomyces cerevisiae YDR110W FOB1 Nucleolar protein that binds the rDNA replication fork barrier (RFB) site [Kazachstania saulgeensis]